MTLPITADDCIQNTIKDCLAGEYIKTAKDASYEVLYYQTGMSNPRARVLTNPNRPLNIVVAVARFVWLAAGNNRLEDIAFYEPKVKGFTDDGLTVPGSDYGHRIFQPRPNLNQVQGVVDRLRNNPGSRQAAIVVWQPEDAVRESRDIPCTFGMFFHIRDNKLNMCVNMRSNNAFRILPFNLFEFTMLHELIATELSVVLGDYVHWAASMHVYHNEREWTPTSNLALGVVSKSIVMPNMPFREPLKQVQLLTQLEAQLRHCCSPNQFNQIMSDALQLDDYWLKLFGVLACWCAAAKDYDAPYNLVHEQLRDQVRLICQKAYQ